MFLHFRPIESPIDSVEPLTPFKPHPVYKVLYISVGNPPPRNSNNHSHRQDREEPAIQGKLPTIYLCPPEFFMMARGPKQIHILVATISTRKKETHNSIRHATLLLQDRSLFEGQSVLLLCDEEFPQEV